jgi:alcohol dehydrogenase, propanol-preferring
VLREVNSPLVLEERASPVPRGDEVLLRVSAVGICQADLHLLDGSEAAELPLVPGHEVAGEDEELGSVLVYVAHGCGACRPCRVGDEQLCEEACYIGLTRDGGYAEEMVVPSRRYLLPLDGLDPARAAPLADAGLTSYRTVCRVSSWLGRNDVAMVVGTGGLGQFALQYLKLLTDARDVAVDVDEAKRARALHPGRR